jgi:hypothetical protein
MATTVDTLLVRIEADMSDLKRSLDKVQRDVQKSSAKVSNSFKQIGTAIKATVGAVVVQQLGRAGMAAINLASDVEEMQGKSKVVFGQFRDQTVAALEDFGNQVGRSTHELEGMASSIQDTFVPMGFARGEAAKLSVELTKLAVDVASFNNASDTETMEAFQSALVGNHETVRRFGVVITEATLKQELLRMGISRTGAEVTNAEKVQARLNLITAGTSDAQGDALRTADSYANSVRALKSEFAELVVELTTLVMPAVSKIVTAMMGATKATKEFLQNIGVLSRFDDDEAGLLAQIAAEEKRLQTLQKLKAEQGSINKLFVYYGDRIDGTARLLATLRSNLREIREENAALAREGGIAQTATVTVETDEGKGPPKPDTLDKGISALLKKNQVILDQRQGLSDLTAVSRVMSQAEIDLNRAMADGSEKRELLHRTNINLIKLKQQFPALNQAELQTLAEVSAQREIDARKLEQTNKAEEEYAAKKQARIDAGLAFVQQQVDADYNLTQSQEALNEARAAGAISADELAAANALLGLETLRLNPMFESFESGAIGLADGVSNAFADMAMGAKVSLQDFENMFKDFVKQMLIQAIKLLVVNAILRALGVPLRYDGKGFKAGAGDAFGGAVPQASAGGGAMSRGRPYLVGERGPELIIPASSGTIKNAHDTRNSMKGGATVVNQTINVETGVSQTVRAEMLSLLPVIKQDTLAAVADGKRRGGSFGQALS